ncbi:MAG: hypothetical protein JSS79_05195 [Bacteroidetes bacterium]|nr:hypothetical protein [Bacteroidota bacterium]
MKETMGNKSRPKQDKQLSIHVTDFQKLLQMQLWREYDSDAEMIRESISIATQYFKRQKERGPMPEFYDDFHTVAFRSDAECDDNLKWLLEHRHFKSPQKAVKTAIRMAYQILEKRYGYVPLDKMPKPNRKKKARKNIEEK